MQLYRAFVASSTLALAVGSLAGCSAHDGGNAMNTSKSAGPTVPESLSDGPLVTIDIHAKHIALRQGQQLRVNIGQVNPSVGDSWSVTGKPDETVLHDMGKDYVSACHDEHEVGCGGTLAWRFQAIKPGQTTIHLSYCYRYSCEADAGQNQSSTPADIDVVVR